MAIYSRLLLCLIAVVMGAMAVSGVANAQTPCAAADALFAGRLYEQAGAQYGEVLKQDATQSCAQEGLSKVAEIQGRATAEYRLGQGYEAAKQTEAARSHYIASLNIDPTYGPSLTALNNILTPAADTPPTGDDEKFGAVRLLLRLGFKDAAEEQVKKIVGDNPVIKVPADVQDQFTGDLQPWHNLKDATWPWLRSAGEVLLLGVIAYVLFLALRRKFSPATRIAVADFEASSESLKGSKGMSAIVQ
ncbi:MAG: hypothetical protein QOH93_2662, partial [Chloroflexia bacterium]|nr:hypothetical protein [Chloroflexia bacterium]